MPALTVQNAQINTATVEIRTLTIGGKQVTLAVFRQLVEELLIDEFTGAFRGLPWGTVNYCPDRTCAKTPNHRHVVWQLGGELRRARVSSPGWYGYQNAFFADCGDDFIQAAYCANNHRLPDWAERRRDTDGMGYEVYFTVDRMLCVAPEPTGSSGWAKHECATGDHTAELRQEVTEEHARREQFRQRWLEIADLPQLFIAV